MLFLYTSRLRFSEILRLSARHFQYKNYASRLVFQLFSGTCYCIFVAVYFNYIYLRHFLQQPFVYIGICVIFLNALHWSVVNNTPISKRRALFVQLTPNERLNQWLGSLV